MVRFLKDGCFERSLFGVSMLGSGSVYVQGSRLISSDVWKVLLNSRPLDRFGVSFFLWVGSGGSWGMPSRYKQILSRCLLQEYQVSRVRCRV